MGMLARPRVRQLARGFSLIELAIVVAIIAVIGAIAVPRLSDMMARSREAQVAETVRGVQTRVEEEFAYARMYPGVPERAWFRGATITNAFFPGRDATIETESDPTLVHPAAKGSDGGLAFFWYNRGNGLFRARVPVQGTAAETIALYARVNGVRVPEAAQEGPQPPAEITAPVGPD